MRRRTSRAVATLIALAMLAVGTVEGLATAGTAQAGAGRVAVDRTRPGWAVRSAEVAQAPPGKTISARVYLAPRDPSGLNNLIAAVSTPTSSSYGHYLTPAEYRARFGATMQAVSRIRVWLRASGLVVSPVQQNGRYLQVTGSVRDAERAFGTQLALFRHSGGTYQAPASTITVPADIGASVLSVTGLDEAPSRITPTADVGAVPHGAVDRLKVASEDYPAAYRTAEPCSAWSGQLAASRQADGKTALPTFHGQTEPYSVCGYTPAQLRRAYGAPATLTGKGVTVAVIDPYLSPSLYPDAEHYAFHTGTPAWTPGQFSTQLPSGGYTDQDACGAPDWSTEQSLDVESVHGFAPGANVIYASARSCFAVDLFDAEIAIVDANRASIITLSYGSPEDQESPTEAAIDTQLFKQAAVQGIGFYIASGDNGDELADTGLKQVDASASNPYATAVGGTSLAIGRSGQYLFETGWGTVTYALSGNGRGWTNPEFNGGAGGGTSTLFARPSYQAGVVGPGFVRRAVPDVAMLADPTTGMLTGFTQAFADGPHYDQTRVGGTSLAAPLFAAAQALVSQHLHSRLGFANPRLYLLYTQQLHGGPHLFHDVTNTPAGLANVRADYADGVGSRGGILYTISTFGQDSSLAAGPGWDDVTGIGTPTAAFFTAASR